MLPASLKRALAFGSGVGIQIAGPRGAESLHNCVPIRWKKDVQSPRAQLVDEYYARLAGVAEKKITGCAARLVEFDVRAYSGPCRPPVPEHAGP